VFCDIEKTVGFFFFFFFLLHLLLLLLLPPIFKLKKNFFFSMADTTEFELGNPPYDGVSSVNFSPQTSNFLLVSSWDCVRPSSRISP